MPVLRPSLATALLCAAFSAQAAWPEQPIRLLVGSPPGAPSDIVARSLADQIGEQLGQPLVVENKPGAGLNLAAGQVAGAKPDGHTFLVTSDTVITVNPEVYSNLAFDARKDLVPVTVLASFTQMLVCNSALGIATVADLREKAKGTNLTYASGGAGVPGHLAAEMLLAETGITMTHIPYRGPGPAITDVVGGQVDCGFLTTPQLLPHVQSGRLKALAVSSAQRSAMAPEVPTAAEAGVTGMDATFFQVLMAPAGTPPEILERLQQAAVQAIATDASQQRLTNLDMAAVGSSRSEAAERLAADTQRWRAIVQKIGLKVD
ncbi:tripartite tricarboxylate transporter substrate binding protein [Achromobacter sp. GG226]|uniref:Bug family tripartite tricarboxylate transporter substrate binding protein n=1 Tax=Verticiella alkaliphila TaxID=2779529 RepID=UPI001C0D9FB2|nr:tripartite tricarboxylate transporter substrate binding protein [Verticiella sp. GG226]MBU4610575.1 tripartite tricarboxylate transporter substrate binding protein [Verticiella sp. GG226]